MCDVINDIMRAQSITHHKERLDPHSLIEMVIWHLDKPVSGSAHHYKYRLVYIVDNQRVVGYDNERGKGDHCHLDDQEQPYYFVDIKTLVDDFMAQVNRRRQT